MLLLTLRYLQHNLPKAVLLALCFAITLFLPLALALLIDRYQEDLVSRAATTPLLLGSKGDRYDLVLNSLYFSGGLGGSLTAADWDTVAAEDRGLTVPLHIAYTARSSPLVGTTLDYFHFRRLIPAEGTFPLRIGDVVLGSEAATSLGLNAGGSLISDQASLFNIAATYPLKMRVTGVLAPTGSADDHAIFTDLKTSWIIAGIAHGHTGLSTEETPAEVLEKEGTNIVANASLVEYTEITPENLATFHLHAGRDSLPLSSVIIAPGSEKDATLLRGRLSISDTLQLLAPNEVIGELLGFVFRIKAFLDRATWLVYFLTSLFTVLVVLLSLRLRKTERTTLARIGCSRSTVFRLQFAELLVLLLAGALVAGITASAIARLFPDVIHSLH